MTPSAVTVPEGPVLVVIPDVELVEVGDEWPASTGPATFTAEDLQAAVDAQSDPAVRSGILKVGSGHCELQEPPSFGRIQNLRTINDGMTLVCDLVGVPRWLAEIMPSAWPSRSIEGERDYHSSGPAGRDHKLVITGLALLSLRLPAISTLEEVRSLYAAESMEEAGVTLEAAMAPRVAANRNSDAVPNIRRSVAAATSVEDVRRAYYEDLGPGEMWWWIRELNVEPPFLIVDDDEGHLWQVSYTAGPNGDVTFGEPSEVRVEYVAAAGASPRPPAETRIVFASRAESRPQEESTVDLTEMRQRLGLPDGTSDEDVLAAATAALPEGTTTGTSSGAESGTGDTSAAGAGTGESGGSAPPPPPPAASGSTIPEGAVLIDAQQLAERDRRLAALEQVAATQRAREEDEFITSVRAQGRLHPRSGDKPNEATPLEATLRREWQRDPETAKRTAASLAQVAPVAASGVDVGHAFGGSDSGDPRLEQDSPFPVVAEARRTRPGRDGKE